MSLIDLADATPAQLAEFSLIAGHEADTMSHIGVGKTWSTDYIASLQRSSRADVALPATERQYFSWLIACEDASSVDNPKPHIAGFISLRPLVLEKNNQRLQIRCFVGRNWRRRQLTSRAIVAAQQLVQRPLFAVVEPGNTPSRELFRALGARQLDQTTKIQGRPHLVFELPWPRAPVAQKSEPALEAKN